MYDLAIIGAGSAGIACAKSAQKFGLKTALLEKNPASIGGTCLNCGCIPTKFFLNRSKVEKNWPTVLKRKIEVIEKIKTPLVKYLNDKGVEIIFGEASFLNAHTLKVGDKKIEARHIVIATGSHPKKIGEEKFAIFAQELFDQEQIPQKILIVGAGHIGIELASLLNNFGKSVWVIEKEERILPSLDGNLSRRLRLILEKKGIKIHTAKTLDFFNQDEFELIIYAAGRTPNTDNLGLEKIGLSSNEGGWIKTDQFMKTNLKNIYACGDVTGKKLLAYVAEYQAQLVLKNIRAECVSEDYLGLAECVFSLPQVAWVGILEEEAKRKRIKHRLIKSNFLKFSSSYVYEDTDGFIYVCLNESDKIIGAAIFSNQASELISIFSLAIKNNLGLKDLAKCTFIHPTLGEIIPLLLKEQS